MSLYGIADIGSPEAKAAYAEIEELGYRRALLVRLRRQQTIDKKRAADRMAEKRTVAAQIVLPIPSVDGFYNRPCASVRKELLLQTMERHGFSLDELLSQRRQLKLVKARQELYARLQQHTRMSYPQIGRYLGGRDHTTIMHGVRKYKQRVAGMEAP